LLHVCGHGTSGGLYLCDVEGYDHLIPEAEFSSLLADCAPPLLCLYLNACYAAIGHTLVNDGVVAYVIGSEDELSDPVAYRFARRFYRELAKTGSIVESHRLTSNALARERVPQHQVPRLFSTVT
jgi:hypothetical protein